ncbi:MAG: hypothetical protein LLG00_05920 [Planctomycetaceae bacterium]|nr:hypothetical protein [Planctomycetaceae bacterium]
MSTKFLFAVTVALCLGGCSSETPQPTSPSPLAVRGKPAATSHPKPTAKVPPAILGKALLPAGATVVPNATTDQFGFPLVIVINPPPVPKEIEGPSPPIKDDSKAH